MGKVDFDFSDVEFGWNCDGFWFHCDHGLNFEAFLDFIKPIYKDYKNMKLILNCLEENRNG